MTKTQLLEAVEKAMAKTGNGQLTRKEIRAVLDTTFDTITSAVKRDDPVSYGGFGTWKLRRTKARPGRNPQTGAALKIKAAGHLGFKESAPVKRALATARPKAKAASG